MNLPRIYSFSTAGILKHLHQDYLIHPVRTDFTGNNGIGKSIIADLIQLIFISDRNLIEFGTDSLDAEKRKIENLPIGGSEGYAFLNIEMTTDQFITIGVCISAKAGIPLKPFVVLSDTDTRKGISELVFPSNLLPTSKDFLDTTKAVLPLQELAKSFKQKLGLSLVHYNRKEQVTEYYSFLFKKGILPINLSMEENLKAFAKIIQSFSKAKGLDIKNSKALKTFLFEDSEKEHMNKYKHYEKELDKLLKAFKSLEADIINIETKQERLEYLKSQERERDIVQLSMRKAELLFAYQKQRALEKELNDLEQALGVNTRQKADLENKMSDLKAKANQAEADFNAADANLSILYKYQNRAKKLSELKSAIDKLEKLQLPELDTYSTQNGDPQEMASWDVVSISKEIRKQTPLLEEYGGLKKMEDQHFQQRQLMEGELKETEKELSRLDAWVSALEKQPADSLISYLVKKGKSLSPQQESVLHYLIELETSKPKHPPQESDRYIANPEIIEEDRFESDSNSDGLWLKLGDLREFVPPLQEAQLFDNPENLSKAINEKLDDFKTKKLGLEKTKKEIQKALHGEHFDCVGLEQFSFDKRIAEHASIKQVKLAIGLMNGLHGKLESLNKELEQEKTTLEQIVADLSIPLSEKINKQIDELTAKKSELKTSKSKLDKEWFSSHESLVVIQGTIKKLEEKLGQNKKDSEGTQAKFQEANREFQTRYQDEEIGLEAGEPVSDEDLSELRETYSDKQRDYESTYKAMITQFEETKSGNPQITTQVDNRTYSFRELESVLLGPRIGYLDKITPYLTEANTARSGMMDGIRDNMVKLFSNTRDKYDEYRRIVQGLNTFFKGKKIGEEYFVNIGFDPHPQLGLDILDSIIEKGRWNYRPGELPIGESVQEFIEDLVEKESALRGRVKLSDLLNPKSYFQLSVILTDEDNNEISGSTGETYSAITLLGIARLSEVEAKNSKGIKFIILEESANLDSINFNLFPKIAKEYGYQIITMTPRPYGADSEDGWYLHQLIKGKDNKKINYGRPVSYFRNKDGRQDLETYLAALKR